MSDIRLSMREFRLLEEKRKLAALSDAEERRWSELGQALGIFEAGGGPARQRSDAEHRTADENAYPNGKANAPGAAVQGSSSRAIADEADGFAEVDPDDIMEVDPSDILLVEPEGEGIASQANFAWVPESAPLPERSIPLETKAPGAAPENAPPRSAESPTSHPDPGPNSIQLTQNFEWVPESAPAERSIPLEAEAAGETAAEPIQLLASESSAETSAANVDPEPSSIPLTQNFEWVPVSPAFENLVSLETETAPEAVQPLKQITSAEAAQLPPEPRVASPQALQLPPEPPIAAGQAAQAPPEQQIALDSPVIDLLESDAMQGELQSNSWESDQAQPGQAGPALAIEDLPPLEEVQIEPVAQWANEPPPPPRPEPPVPAQAPPPAPLEARLPYAADSTSATGYTQISSSGQTSPSFHFEINEALTPPTPPDPQPEGIAAAPAVEEHRAQVAPAPIVLGGAAAEAPPAQGDSETSFEDVAPPAEANNGVNTPFVAGQHRVVVHLIDGQVKRGTVQDLDLTAGSVPLQSAPGVVDNIATDRLKAIFFMLAPGAPKIAPSGQKIRLTLQDGREVVGFSEDYKTGDPGFFLRPADDRTNTARIFVPRWSVYSIDEQ